MPNWLHSYYRRLQFAADGSILAVAFVLAVGLRFDFLFDTALVGDLASWLPFVVLVQLSALLLVGAHQRSWRHVGLADLPAFLRAGLYSTALILFVRLAPVASLAPLRVPLSIIAGDAVFAFGGVVAIRVLRRGVQDYLQRRRTRDAAGSRLPVFLVGAGRAGVLAVRELDANVAGGIVPIGFIDDDPFKQGSVVAGLRVLGTTADLPALVSEWEPDHVVLTIADARVADKQRIVEICRRIPIRLREIPGYYEILQGTVSLSRLRDVDPSELLGRPAVKHDAEELAEFLSGRNVLVTGAGGSIGAELAGQIARMQPRSLVLLERSEYALFTISEELKEMSPDFEVVPELADVASASRLEIVFARYRPDVVIHAAAHKHVTMLERHPAEAVHNNILGTHTIAEIAGRAGVDDFVMVSTDKAVNPTSVMGASKRVAELIVQAMNDQYATTYSAVRFGNVLGSTGSVIPIFKRQIAQGGPVTVTDPEMKRYFMSIPEAAQLVLRAGSLARGGEIFVLDMGDPVRIMELAEKMITLSGFVPHKDIAIVLSGRRPGEKLFEELGTPAEGLDSTRHPKIHIGRLTRVDGHTLERSLEQLAQAARVGDTQAILRGLSDLLPESCLENDSPRARSKEAL